MKARTIQWIDTAKREIVYGIEIQYGSEKLFASEAGKPILSTNKKEIMRKVRQINRENRFTPQELDIKAMA